MAGFPCQGCAKGQWTAENGHQGQFLLEWNLEETPKVRIANCGSEVKLKLCEVEQNSATLSVHFLFHDVVGHVHLIANASGGVLLEGNYVSARDRGIYSAAGASNALLEHVYAGRDAGNTSVALAQSVGLRLFAPHGEHVEAVQHLRNHGFVVITGAIDAGTIAGLQDMMNEEIRNRGLDRDGGNRGSGRYELGSLTHWAGSLQNILDAHAVDDVLSEFYGSRHIRVQLVNGIVTLPGAGQQGMHIDLKWDQRFLKGSTPPALKVYFNLIDHDDETGPTRFVPGSHRRTALNEHIPTPEPESILAFCPAGSATIMDMRVWHGGTANKSRIERPIIGIHYVEPNFDAGKYDGVWYSYARSLDSRDFARLPLRAQDLCRNLVRS